MIQNYIIQLEIEKCQMQKLREFFSKKKISLSQMIQNCLIRREMAKKKFGGRRRFSAAAAGPPPFFQFSVWQHSILRIFKKN